MLSLQYTARDLTSTPNPRRVDNVPQPPSPRDTHNVAVWLYENRHAGPGRIALNGVRGFAGAPADLDSVEAIEAFLKSSPGAAHHAIGLFQLSRVGSRQKQKC